jgi:hypothetical protein
VSQTGSNLIRGLEARAVVRELGGLRAGFPPGRWSAGGVGNHAFTVVSHHGSRRLGVTPKQPAPAADRDGFLTYDDHGGPDLDPAR